MKIAVIFAHLGPYHRARLQACASGCDLTAVQVFARSTEYGWQAEAGPCDYRVVALFEEETGSAAEGEEVDARMSRSLDNRRPDVVFIPGWSGRAAFSALLWSLRHHIPAVAMSDSTARDERRIWWKERVKKRIVRLFSAALTAGNPQRDYLVQLGLPADRISLGYDVVDNAYFEKKAHEVRARESEIRTTYALPESYFLACARFVEKKNLPGLLRAYARYRAGFEKTGGRAGESVVSRPWSLVLLGDGPLRPKLERLTLELGLKDCVQMPGFKQYSELPFYYARASAFILASTSEQWGLVVNEAMASRLPVLISNRCGCAVDLVQEGRNGFLFDPCDVEECARLMHRMSSLATPVLNEMGRASERIIAEWGTDRFVNGLTQAARRAMEVGPCRASWLDRALLHALLRRQ